MQRSRSDKLPNRGEAGQVMVMAVFFLLLAVVIAAFVIDIGLFLRERRHLQNMADAAALAGAQELPNEPAAAVLSAEDWAVANGHEPSDPDRTFEANTPYNGDPRKIEVEVSNKIGVFFAKLFSPLQDVSARGVATRLEGPEYYAIFANRNDCNDPSSLVFSGSEIFVEGRVHSNGDTLLNGSVNEFNGVFTYQCQIIASGSGNTHDPPPAQTDLEEMPINYAFTDFPCDITYTQNTDLASRPEVWVGNDPLSKQLKPLVICSTADLQLSGFGVTGTVTLAVQDELKISGSNFNLTGLWNDVLAYSSAAHDKAIDISASGGDWLGVIHAPNGKVKVAGGMIASDSLDLVGSIIADTVQISGSNFTITGRFIEDPDLALRLIE